MATELRMADLEARIRRLTPGSIVAIEGFCGSGKSTLANGLAKNAGLDVLHSDQFVRKYESPPPYLDCVDLPRFASALNNRMSGRVLIVEGICLRDLLGQCRTTPALSIYVRRISTSGLWHDHLHLLDFLEGQMLGIGEPELSDLEYHARVMPQELADVTFSRIETA